MRLRGPLVSTGALGLAVLIAGSAAAWTSINRADTINKTRLATTINVNSVVTFAPPPSNVTPALTALQALRESESRVSAHVHVRSIPPDVTAKLGLLTLLVGPYCGAECHGLIVRKGMAYQDFNKLAYGYYSNRPSTCMYTGFKIPRPPGRCISWEFVDATTGRMIIGTQQQIRPDHAQAPASAG